MHKMNKPLHKHKSSNREGGDLRVSDDIDKKFKQIADMIGQKDSGGMPDNVKSILNMFMSSASQKSDEAAEPSEDSEKSSRSSSEDKKQTGDDDTQDLARKMKKAVDMLGATTNDPRANLLNALHPYLNKERQKKLQKCMKLIKLGSLTKLMDES